MNVKKYDILLVDLNPTRGSEQQGVRPCLVIQINAAIQVSSTTVVCILSSVIKDYPHTLIVQPSEINNLKNESRVDLLQVRTIDRNRIISRIGKLDDKYRNALKSKLVISFDIDDIL